MSTKLFKAMKSLHGCFRWCLTGTPVQNGLEDLVALVSFIRSSPLDDLQKFRKFIISPLMRRSENGEDNLRLLLDSVCLRRTKKLLSLPDATFETRILSFSTKEEQQYVNTRDKMILKMKQVTLHPKNKKGHLGVFQLLLQLRRLCNHGTFQKLSLDSEDFDPEQAIDHLRKEQQAKCQCCELKITTICGLSLPGKSSGSFTTCGHLLCVKCLPEMKLALQRIEGREGYFKCSLCSEAILGNYVVMDESLAQQPRIGSKRLSPWQYFDKDGWSTKISALVRDIEKNETPGKR
jgi:SNF2 family DNA or RNA helicase